LANVLFKHFKSVPHAYDSVGKLQWKVRSSFGDAKGRRPRDRSDELLELVGMMAKRTSIPSPSFGDNNSVWRCGAHLAMPAQGHVV